MKSTIFKTVFVTVLFGALHSFLASRRAKDYAARRFGQERRNALYRAFFVSQSLLTVGLFGFAALRWPDRTLWRARGLLAWLMRLGQLGGLVLAFLAAWRVGLARISGLSGLLAWLRGDQRIPPEPEAQGPALAEDGLHMDAGGPFRVSRHPLNLAPLPIFWLFPHMTIKLAAFSFAASIYLVLGSYHEEARLRSAYGQPYKIYEASGVPFYL